MMRFRVLAVVSGLGIACGGTRGTETGPVRSGAEVSAGHAAASPTDAQRGVPTGLRLPDGVAPTRYSIELTLSPDADTFTGQAEIDIELAAPTQVLWLNGKLLDVRSATVRAGGADRAARVLTPGRELLGFDAGRPLPAGEVTLRVRYRGKLLSHEEGGLFRRREGGERYIFSQLEPTDARRVFPAFDDPQFKVPFQLSLTVPETMLAVSNTPVRQETPAGNGMKRVQFEPTPPLPSYLVALAVGPFEVVDAGTAGRKNTPLRIIVPRGRKARAAYAVEVTKPILELLEAYFDMPYPYRKLDQIAVPTFLGAMENPGLVTYHQELLLMDPAEDTLKRQRRFAGTCAHELAHMWFGDLVTMNWWNDIWLNESFATWMAARTIDEWKPEWDGPVRAANAKDYSMRADSLDAARKIRQPIETSHDIPAAFDGITYGKGAAVLRMFESWMGKDDFQARVRAYVRTWANQTATGEDFLAALSAGGRDDVGRAFATFIDQSGVPEVRAELSCAAGATPTLALSQRRFVPLGSPADRNRTWHVPVCVEYGAGKRRARDCTLMTSPTAVMPLGGIDGTCPAWVVPNDGMAGYYRVRYSAAEGAALLANRALSVAEYVGVIRDVNAQIRAGTIPKGTGLAWVAKLAGHKSPHVRGAALSLAHVDRAWLPGDLEDRYGRFVRKTFGRYAHKLGYRVRAGETEQVRLLRPKLLYRVAIRGRDPKVIAGANVLAKHWLVKPSVVHPDLVDTVLSIAAHEGDLALWQRLYERAMKTDDSKERGQMIDAMGEFVARDIVDRNLALVLSTEIELNETFQLVFGALSEPANRDRAWAFVTKNFDALLARFPKFSAADMVYTGSFFCDAGRSEEVEAFFRPRIDRVPGGPRVLDQVLEQLRLCVESKNYHLASMAEFLGKH